MKTAFLDLDGTLIDSKKRHINVLCRALDIFGITYDKTIAGYVDYKSGGKNTRKYLQSVFNLQERELTDVVKYWIEHIEDEDYLKSDSWYDGAEEFVSNLYSRDYRIIILTARNNRNFIYDFLYGSDICEYISEIFVVPPNNAKNEKCRIVSELKTDESLIIGDTEVDYYAGAENGIDTYVLNSGFRNEKFWNDVGIKSYSCLQEIMKELGD